MYLCLAVPTLSSFYLAKLDFVAPATRRDTLFAIFALSPSWVVIFDNILFLGGFLISDTLLVSRPSGSYSNIRSLTVWNLKDLALLPRLGDVPPSRRFSVFFDPRRVL